MANTVLRTADGREKVYVSKIPDEGLNTVFCGEGDNL